MTAWLVTRYQRWRLLIVTRIEVDLLTQGPDDGLAPR